MRRLIPILCLSIAICNLGHAQDTLAKKLDSLRSQPKSDSAAGKEFDIHKTAYNERTKMTGKAFFTLLGSDFTQEVTGPFHTNGKAWKKVGAFALIEGGLFLADKDIRDYAQNLMNRNPKMQNTSQYITNFGGTWETYTLAAFAAYGFVFNSDKVKTTTLLALQSYMASGAMQFLVKYLTGEQRPSYTGTDYAPGPKFHGPAFSFRLGGSTTAFPSGHTTAVFAAATVFAEEYRDRPLVPIISYTAATLVGLSRITQNAHWASDVFAGAALGYVTGLQVVRNYHRYAYLKNHPKTPVRSISFTGVYNYDHVEPALVIGLR